MSWLIAITGLFAIAFVSPGPNNFIVMGAAARAGARGVLSAAAGIIAGGCGLLLLVWAGLGVLLAGSALFAQAIVLAGGAYLLKIGAMMIFSPSGLSEKDTAAGLPTSMTGIALFQLANPKAWVVMTTATAASPATVTSLFGLWAMIALVSLGASTLWGAAGAIISRWLQNDVQRRWFDRLMGALLIGCAGLLVWQTWP